MGHVFMGRRSELATEAARERLHALNIENRAHVEVHTLDRFLEMAGTSLNFGHSYLPHEALTDSDLRVQGLPAFVRHFIKSDFGSQTLFLEERPYRDRFDEDYGLGDESEVTTVTPSEIEIVTPSLLQPTAPVVTMKHSPVGAFANHLAPKVRSFRTHHPQLQRSGEPDQGQFGWDGSDV
jgi:hypothetical protein